MMPIIQVPSIVLPQVWTLGTEIEIINDLVTHPSIDIPTEYLQEKVIHIFATEVVASGVPGNLWLWVELSPVASATSTSYWAGIGGGGGVLDPATGLPYINPAAPTIEVALGVAGAPPTFASTIHTLILPWAIHSAYARLVAWTPVAAAPATAFWTIQAIVSAKT
ncbi:MAG: hypothetical protein Q7J06_05080 [Bacteroidales bacterium]|nr:hypothetical protein [Bacteroidales bacterium]